MYAKLILYGDGSDEGPYRCNMVNYTAFETNYDDMWQVVSFGARDQPPSLPVKGSPLYPLIGTSYILVGLTPDQLTAWWALLLKRYPGHEPPYEPDFP